jgi:hypothetical protein
MQVADNTSIWAAINLRETIANVQAFLSTYLNESKFILTNTSIWAAINLRETISNTQSLLSTYLNESKFILSNTTTDNRLDTLEGAGYITNATMNKTVNWSNVINSPSFITNATMNKSVRCQDIYGSPDSDFCTDSTGVGGGVWSLNQSLNTTDNAQFNMLNVSVATVRSLTAASCDVKANTNGTIYCGTDATGSGSSSSPVSYAKLGADLLSKKGIPTTNATGLNFTLYASNYYQLSCNVIFTVNDTTGGARFGLWYPTATIASFNVVIPQATDGVDSFLEGTITASGDNVTATAGAGKDIRYIATIDGNIYPTATAKIQVIYGNELATTNTTVKQGSFCTLTNMTGAW